MATWPTNSFTMGDRVSISPGGSPFTYQNATNFPMMVVVSAGTVTVIEFSRDGTTFDTLGLISGMYRMNPGDRLRVTYAVAPTMAYYPI